MINLQPLKIKSNEFTCRKIEEIFEKNTYENVNLLKKLFEEIKQESIEVVNQQLNRFRDVKQIGKFQNFLNLKQIYAYLIQENIYLYMISNFNVKNQKII